MNIKILNKIIISLILIITIFTLTNINKVEAFSISSLINANKIVTVVNTLGDIVKTVIGKTDESTETSGTNGISLIKKIGNLFGNNNDSSGSSSGGLLDVLNRITSGLGTVSGNGGSTSITSHITNMASGLLGDGNVVEYDKIKSTGVKENDYDEIIDMYEEFISNPLNGGLNMKNLCTWWCCCRAQKYIDENEEGATNPFTYSLLPITWLATARAAGYTVDDNLSENSIIVYNSNQGYAEAAGHVAYIEKAYKNGEYLVSEANMSDGNGGIYACYMKVRKLSDNSNWTDYAGIIHLDKDYVSK